jgi:hypothetical protein
MRKHCNNSQCFKEKNYKAKFSINSILKKNKIDRNNFRKKTGKKHEKKQCWKHRSNSRCFVMKAIVFPHII